MNKLLPYLKIMRVDHWFKNAFCIPGIVLAYVLIGRTPVIADLPYIILGLIAVSLTASANYTLNEVLDAANDREHPDKSARPVASGQVNIKLAYLQYVIITLAAFGIAYLVNLPFMLSAVALWVMGIIYNVPPLRSKELSYFDALSEAINNPLRLMLGWWMVDPTTWPPLSIVAAYWMFGAFLMAMKRCAEYKHIGDHDRASRYRKSFAHTDDLRLLISAVIYNNIFYLLLGIFIAKFRVELIFSIPFLALFGAYYIRIGFRNNSVVQYPEKLYREKKLMVMLAAASLSVLILLLIDLPFLGKWFHMHTPMEPQRMTADSLHDNREEMEFPSE